MNPHNPQMDAQKAAQIAEAAGYWDARLRAPGCTNKDREDFAAWRDAQPGHREAMDRLQAIVSTLRQDRSRADLRAMRDAALALAARRRRHMRWTVAAGFGAVALTALLWALGLRTGGFDWSGSDTFSTGIGQRTTVTLQDGSTVDLNSRSRIRVALGEEHRSITLLEGQAVFQVAKDPRRPFVVRAADREIVAIGTAFDIRLDSSTMRVTLLEGRIAVMPQGGTLAAEAPRPGAEPAAKLIDGTPSSSLTRHDSSHAVYLSPGQQLVVATGGDSGNSAGQAAEVRDIDVDKVTSWRAGQVFFEDSALSQAVAEMNKHSTVRIDIEDPALQRLRVNGMFRTGEQQAFAHALEEYFPLIAERRGDDRIVLKSRR